MTLELLLLFTRTAADNVIFNWISLCTAWHITCYLQLLKRGLLLLQARHQGRRHVVGLEGGRVPHACIPQICEHQSVSSRKHHDEIRRGNTYYPQPYDPAHDSTTPSSPAQ